MKIIVNAVTAAVAALALGAAASAQSPAQKPARARTKAAPASAPAKSAPESEVKSDAAAWDEVERLLDKYVLAQGGPALVLLKTRTMRGSVEMSGSPLPGTFESYEKMPKKSLVVINAPGGQFIRASDDGRTWLKSPLGGAMTVGSLGDDALSRGREGGFKWRSRFSSARVRGRAVVGGRPAVVLAATPVGRGPVVMYFDADTGLLLKQELVRAAGAGGDELEAVYIDSYGTVDGVKVPALFRHVYGKHTMTFRVVEVKHNVPIDDALFADPNDR